MDAVANQGKGEVNNYRFNSVLFNSLNKIVVAYLCYNDFFNNSTPLAIISAFLCNAILGLDKL